MHDSMSKQDNHPVCHLIYSGLHHSLSNNEGRFQPRLDAYPQHLHNVIRDALVSQERIGWTQATKGYFSVRWRELASLAQFSGGKDETRGIARMRNLIDAVHAHNIRLWKSRNDVLHSKDDATLAEIRSSETVELTRLHGQPEQLSSADRYLCSRSLENLLSSAPATRRRWMRRVKESRDRHERDGSRQVLLTSFFHPSA